MKENGIRLVREADAPVLSAIYAPYVHGTSITFETEAPDSAEMARRIAETTQFPYLVCEADGEVLGYAYAKPFRSRAAYSWDAETSVYVRQDSHRRGVASALYTALLALLDAQGVYNVYAIITTPNEKSEGFHRKFGFEDAGVWRRVGYKLGGWHDVRTMEKWLRGDSGAPRPVVPAGALDERVIADALAAGSARLRGR